MKKSIFFFAVMAIGLSGFSQGELEKLIREREQMETTAVIERDIETLKKIWAKDFLVNNPYNEIITDRNQVFDFMRSDRINYSHFERVIEHVKILDDMVITMGHEEILHATTGNTIRRRYTNIWMLNEGEWIIRIRHANIINVQP